MNVLALMSNALLVTYTLFPDVTPATKTERADVPWETLVDNIRKAPTYINKAACPLISMGEYGDLRTDKDCLRHAANVQRVFGVELDYDGEQMPIEEGAAILQRATICSVLYTSPSHTPEKPRWRALLPLSEPALPDKRREYVGRANRLLGGIASRESFTLSQSFYLGRVRGAEYVVIDTQGRYIDCAFDIEPLYHVGGVNDGESARDATTDAQLRECFEQGAGRYEAMLKLSARWAARGMPADDIESNLLALLGAGYMNHDGIDLRTRARPMADSAVRKFGDSRLPAPQAQLPAQPAPDQEQPPHPAEAEPAQGQRIEATVFEWVDPKTIPPRPWLFGHHYMRGMVSATAGVGGAGKSTLLNVELVSMAIGKDLLRDGREIPVGPLAVWGHNGEDPKVELDRRLMAVCQYYGVTKEDLGGRLRITSGRDMPIMVARELADGGKLLVPTEDGKQIAAEILKHGIQVFVADPFVTIHRVNENDNTMIDCVMTILRDLADQTRCALEVAHHFRKLNGEDASVDAVRGAGAIIGACRSVRITSSMSKEDAAKYGIDDEQRGFYLWLQNGKSNMLPPTHKRQWLFMASANLGNEAAPFKSDEVGVVTTWTPPEMSTDLTPPEFRDVRKAIHEANPIAALRHDVRSTGWIGNLMAATLGRDATDKVVKGQMLSLIARLEHGGHLKRQEVRDPRAGRSVSVFMWVKGAEVE
jgi:hypothetical protein